MTGRLATVLFVCVENSCRSQMAEGFARQHGAGIVEAWSAGSRPSGIVSPDAEDSMREKGIDLLPHHSKGVSELPRQNWDWVITMGCGDTCPALEAKNRAEWDLPDPRGLPPEEFAIVRDEIEKRVCELLEQVAAKDATN
jgi:protein-tyrosine-phosphatase